MDLNQHVSDSESLDFVQPAGQRPTFLTVLCIVTFVVSGWYFIGSIISLFSPNSFDDSDWEQITEQMSDAMGGADENSRQMMENMMTAMASTMQAAMQNALALGIVELIASGLSLLGAFMMFKLRKTGYYTYIGSKVIGIVVPLALLGLNMVTGIMYTMVAIIGLLFIILYGVNRKYMH